MFRKFIILTFVFMLMGCIPDLYRDSSGGFTTKKQEIPPPSQNPNEFRAEIKERMQKYGKKTSAKVVSFETNLPYNKLYNNMNTVGLKCLNFILKTDIEEYKYGMKIQKVARYNSYIKKISSNKATLVVQNSYDNMEPAVKKSMPKGGFYHFVIDIEGKGKGLTSVTVYGDSPKRDFGENIFKVFPKWADGSRTSCTKYIK